MCEKVARDALSEKFDVPIVLANELVGGLNMMERGATELLNARLLPVVDQFMKTVKKALEARGLTARRMIVRSDGSLMTDELAKLRPVETILSGSAASVMGSRSLAECESCLILDMGGTTTDVSIIRGGAPHMSGGIRIGGWRMQVRGVFIDTFGLGGDSRVYMHNGQLKLDARRVEPICAAAVKWPRIKEELKKLLSESRPHTRPLHEFLYLVHAPAERERYAPEELRLVEMLTDGPQMIGGDEFRNYAPDSARLEAEGVVMRCGLTPTDVMHIRGDYAGFDAEASYLAARYFLRSLPEYLDNESGMETLCENVYEMVTRRLYENLARVLIESAYPDVCAGGIGPQLDMLIAQKWEKRNEPEDDSFFSLKLDANAALIGIGAPTHLFQPEAARALGMQCVIPEHSEAADVTATVRVEVHPVYTSEGVDGYTIHAVGVNERFGEWKTALEGAPWGELCVSAQIIHRKGHTRAGAEVRLGAEVVGTATGRMI